MKRFQSFFTVVFLLAMTGCNEGCESEHYEQADKGFESEEIDGERADLPPQKTITLQFTSEGIEPSTITALPQQPVKLVIQNNDNQNHSLAFELTAGVVGLEEEIEPGHEKTMSFAAPRKWKDFPFYDPLKNNREEGWNGVLKIEKPDDTDI